MLKNPHQTGLKKFFVIKKFKNAVSWTYFINDLNGKEIIGTFYEKELQKTNQQEFRIEKVIKRKGDKLYIKWKGCDSSFNSWIDKKRFSMILLISMSLIAILLYKNESIFSKTVWTIWWR